MKTRIDKIQSLLKNQSRRLVLRYVHVGLMLILLCAAVLCQAPDRSKPPMLGQPSALKLPSAQKFILTNGLPVYILEKHNVPVLQINLIIRTGPVYDPDNKAGLASLTSAMLLEGSGKHSSLEFADAIDFLGAEINSTFDKFVTRLTLRTPVSKLDAAFELFADAAMRPLFPEEELARQIKNRLTELMQERDNANVIAAQAFRQALFGKHPMGKSNLGSEESIKSFTIQDIKNFYLNYYNASNSFIAIVGDVNTKEIIAKLENSFGKWEKPSAPAINIEPPQQVKGINIYLVDKPKSPQTVIRIGRIGAERNTDDYFPIIVMNTILGGSFSSRLNSNLREKHGYTYGAGSNFNLQLIPGDFFAGASVQTEVTDSALIEFIKEFKNIQPLVSDEELSRAKNFAALRYPDDFQTVADISSSLNSAIFYNLPEDYFNTYISRVLAVTKEDVQRVAQKYIDPENLAIVIVGDREKIEKGIQALNLGPIKNLTIDDVLGKVPTL